MEKPWPNQPVKVGLEYQICSNLDVSLNFIESAGQCQHGTV